MKKSINLKKILLSIFLTLFIALVSIFCIDFVSNKKTVHADTSGNFSSSFEMVPGISMGYINEEVNYIKGRVQVRITEEIYNLLYTDGEDFHDGSNGWFHSIGYKKSKYYLMLCCSTTEPRRLYGDEVPDYNDDEYQPNVFSQLYSAHPEDSVFMSEEIDLRIDSEGYYVATFIFPFHGRLQLSSSTLISVNYNVDFYYYVDVVASLPDSYDYEKIVTSHGFFGDSGTKNASDRGKFFKYRTTDYIKRNHQQVARLVLENEGQTLATELGEQGLAFVKQLNKFAGYTSDSDTCEVQVKYKKCYGFNDFREETLSYFVDSLLVHSPSYVYQTICNIMGYVDISAFNCIYENYKAFIDGTVLNTDRKIVLQADGYSYSFDDSSQIGTLTIEYTTFHYKDFCVKLTDNDEEDAINLSMYIYATDIYPVVDDRYCLTFDFSTIIHQSFASVGWIFELKPSNFNIVNGSSDVTTVLTNTYLKVFFTDEEELSKVSISALAEIITDYQCTVNVNYADLSYNSGNIEVNDETFTETMMYSDLIKIYNPTSFLNRYNTRIQDGLSISGLSGITYYEYSNLNVVKVDSANYNINVSYTYNTLLKISNNINNTVKFYNLTKNSLIYDFSEFNYTVPTNYRIKNLSEISSETVQHVIIDFDELYPNDSKLTFITNLKQNLIIDLRAELSDKWPVKINYLKQYEDSCFATLETYSGEISFADYSDLNDITGNDIEAIIGAENVKHIMFGEIPIRINDDTITFQKIGNSYEFNFEYSYHYIKTMDSNGNVNYFNVPLTPFSKWQQFFGEEWSIVALAPDVFTYSDEVDAEKLYGFFSVMTFQEQVSNFNSWFHEYAGGGCCNFFSQKQIQGSGFYRFMSNNPALLTVAGGVTGLIFGHPIIGTALGSVATFSILSISEALNEDNGTYYSYFFYLDGTTDKSWIAHNGADSYDDESSAFHNAIESIKESSFFQKLGAVGVLLCGIVVGVILLLLWIKLFLNNVSRVKPVIGKIIFIALTVAGAVLIGFYVYWIIELVMSMGGL